MKTFTQFTFEERIAIARNRGYLRVVSNGDYKLRTAYLEYCKEIQIPCLFVIEKYKFAYLEGNLESLPRVLTEPEIDKIYDFLTAEIREAAKTDMINRRNRYVFVSDVRINTGDFRGGRYAGEWVGRPLLRVINKLVEVEWTRPPCEVWE